MRIRGRGRGERGQSLVELALTLPILMSMMMGILDLSFVLYANIQVSAACAEGARAGALHPGDFTLTTAQNDAARLAAVKGAIYNSGAGVSTLGRLQTAMPYFDVNSDVQISYPGAASSVSRTGDDLVVSVVYRQAVWFNFLPGVVSGRFQVSSSTRMRIQ